MKKLIGLIFVFYFLWTGTGNAAVIYLLNGDKISGNITANEGQLIQVQTLAIGPISINKSFVDMLKTFPRNAFPAAAPAVKWSKDISLGYTQNGGNTKTQQGHLATCIDRKTSKDEETMKLDMFYADSDEKMSERKFYGMFDYEYNFGARLKWYNFYKLEGDQDYANDIYYRLTPSTGLGHFFSDTPDFKAKVDLGLGGEYTYSRIEKTLTEEEPVLDPHFCLDKRVVANLHFLEDWTEYPSLEYAEDFRIRAETDLVDQLTKFWLFKISFVDAFDSAPQSGVKKNDYTWTTSLVYHF